MAGFDLSGDSMKRSYGVDKFGFMIADLSDARRHDYGEDRRKSRINKPPSPFRERSERMSPKRKDMRESRIRHDRRDERDRREGRLDNRFSPFREEFFREEPERRRRRSTSRDYGDLPDNWENQFNQPSVTNYPSHQNVSSFSNDQMNLFPPHNYENHSGHPSGQYSGSGVYGGYPQSMAQPQSIQSIMSDLPLAPHPPDIQWHLPPPGLGSNIRHDLPEEDQMKKEAIASEVRQQKATLIRQKEEYLRKVDGLKREMDTLREQRAELRGNSRRSPSPDSRRFLKENAKLQLEIQNKLKTMNNVIDMLSGIIGDSQLSISPEKRKSPERKEHKLRKSRSPGNSAQSLVDSSPEREKRNKKKSRSRSRSVNTEKKFNYVYYDPEMHWCRICNDFPPTAKDYLNHLHNPYHQKNAAPHVEAPWHNTPNLHEGLPNYPNAPNKRTPIRGLQFFIPSTAWFCKLCDQWIGDLHCASAHLKSLTHSRNYTTFVEQNPHWEIDWMSDRQKAFQKARNAIEAGNEKLEPPAQPYTAHTITFDKDGFRTKRKLSPADDNEASKAKKDKKKKKDKKGKRIKKRSSSSSSQSSNSEIEPSNLKKSIKQVKGISVQQEGWRRVPSPTSGGAEDRILSQWMSQQDDRLSEHDKRVLQNLKNRKQGLADKSERIKTKKEKKKEMKATNNKKDSSNSSSESSNSESETSNIKKPTKPIKGINEQQESWRRVSSPSGGTAGEDRMLSQWMSLQDDRLSEQDKRVLQNLKNRVKTRIAVKASNTADSQGDNQNNLERKGQSHSTRPGQGRNVHNPQRGPKDRDHHARNREPERHRDNRHIRHREERREDHSLEDKPRQQQPAKQRYQEQDKEQKNQQDQKKMPFIGKMPVFKVLTKPPQKPEEAKENDQDPSKIEETEMAKKRRDEINAQIQKTVQEFKDKIKQEQKALLNRSVLVGPGVALPTALGGVVTSSLLQPLPASVVASLPQTIHRIQKPPVITTSAPPTAPTTQNTKLKTANKDDPLHKDFQEALDIIFPSEDKKPSEQKLEAELLPITDPNMMMAQGSVPTSMSGYGMIQGPMMSGGYMAQPPMGLMGHMPPGFHYDYNSLYHQEGMYDMTVHMGPQMGPANMHTNENGEDLMPVPDEIHPPPPPMINEEEVAKAAKMQELDDLAMLGIEAEDVGAGRF